MYSVRLLGLGRQSTKRILLRLFFFEVRKSIPTGSLNRACSGCARWRVYLFVKRTPGGVHDVQRKSQ